MVRNQQFKLILDHEYGIEYPDQLIQLYDLHADIGEAFDLSRDPAYREILETLLHALGEITANEEYEETKQGILERIKDGTFYTTPVVSSIHESSISWMDLADDSP